MPYQIFFYLVIRSHPLANYVSVLFSSAYMYTQNKFKGNSNRLFTKTMMLGKFMGEGIFFIQDNA